MTSNNQQTQIETVDALIALGMRFITYDMKDGRPRGWWASPEYNPEGSEDERRGWMFGNNPQEFYYAAEITVKYFLYPLSLRKAS